jgi:UDP-3-O-acyl-N-acetylglucosamine deacetylase
MALLNQKTLTKPISFNGIGLHSGKSVKLTVNPSEPDTGIII